MAGNRKNKTLVLLSGGLDSAACLALLKSKNKNVEALFIDYGQLAVNSERKAASLIASHYRVRLHTISLKILKQKKAGELFGRNLFLIAAAAIKYGGYTGGVTISCGIHAGTPYLDCSEEFVNQIASTLRFLSQERVQFIAPFKTWDKLQVFKYANRHHVPIQISYSCERGTPKHCGKCQSCLDRKALEC